MTHLYNGMSTTAGALLYPNPGRLPPGMASVSGKFLVPRSVLRPESLVIRDSVRHPRRVRYQVPAEYRAAAHALAHPGTTLTGFGALALYGLPHLVDAHDTVLISPKCGRKQWGTQFTPTVVRKPLRPGETWHVLCCGEPISVAAPPVAVVQALKLIRTQQCSWPVHGSKDEEVFVRAVQLVDASRRFLGLTPEEIAEAGHNRLAVRWLASVLKASSALADSPKETEMRFLAAKVAAEFGLRLEEQVEFFEHGRPLTRADLGFPQAQVALFYDGIHHEEKKQRIYDNTVDRALAVQQWTALRYTQGTLGLLIGQLRAILTQRGFVRINNQPSLSGWL